ncbi:MAG: alkaline phosphatase family protein [Sulfuritalea sp.]|nr:alkaline phosphatase family protein [Sulfuritalea sp.]MDP1981470.1 alkaline phosphatase family protein [Sulfuritalea sp.]
MSLHQRVVVGMIDGFGLDYYAAQSMPALRRMAAAGLEREVKAVMPTVTNVNNVSISCSTLPREHGLTGNSYYNVAAGEADYMENADFLQRPTLSQRAAQRGIKSALLTCKQKSINLLAREAEIAIAAENPPPEYVARFGPAPDIYSREINYWLWQVAIDLLKTRPDIGVIYVHTTDYPMHAWAPEREESREHLARLDALIGEAAEAAPDAAFFLTADHGMNYKTRCWDLDKALRARGAALRFALSAEKDRYIKHHRTFGGTAYVWLNAPEGGPAIREQILALEGIEAVRTREEAARDFDLMPERIGDLVVTGDRETVFGELAGDREDLEAGYRSHGSLHESDVPLIIYNWRGELPAAECFRRNADLLHFVMN